MNELQIFNNEEFGEIRTVIIDNQPYFVGKDVAEVLGYSRPNNAIRNRVDEEDRLLHQISASGQNREMQFINESGLYSLVLTSKLPGAKNFKRWVTSEVLPTIRKNGMYATDQLLDNPDLLIKVATKLKEEREKRKFFENKVEEDRSKVIFANSVETSKQSILVGDLAKIIKQNGVDMGQNRLFEWLRNNGYLISRKGDSYNMPTQLGMDLKLFEVKESTHTNPDGSVRLTKTTKVTGKGQVYFIEKFLKFKEN